MSESRAHIELVELTYNYIKSLVPPDRSSLIQYDSADSDKPSKVIGNYIPDVYYCSSEQLIIGEAKTVNDFDRGHSYCQYSSYLVECENFSGEARLVISVPWSLALTAKNYFKRTKFEKKYRTKIIILNELGWFAEI